MLLTKNPEKSHVRFFADCNPNPNPNVGIVALKI